jgi:uncharacterized RDD family membrane protein YckC
VFRYGQQEPRSGATIGPSQELAGFWRRVGGFVIDGLIASAFTLPGRFVQAASDGDAGASLGLLLYVAGIAAFVVLYSRLVGGRGQSWGHQAVGVMVIDARSGTTIGTGRAVGRYFAQILSALPCYLGFFWCIWDPRKQTFHDKIVNTVVVRR